MNYQLFRGDCLEIMPTLEAQSVDMILADTPFGTTRNAWDTVLDLPKMWAQSRRVIKPNGAIVHFATQPYTSMLVMSHLEGYKHRWIWNKKQAGNFAVSKYMPMSIDEDILVFTANGERVNYYPIMTTGEKRLIGGRNSEKHGRGFGGLKQVYYESDEYHPKSILEFSVVIRWESLHPSQKPTNLLSYLIRTYTTPGGTVLDFCMGSGSAGVACAEVEPMRKFVGIEKDAAYFAIAQDRIEKAYRRANGEARKGKASDTENLPLFA